VNEHDDDLESEVDEGAEEETDSYPVTGDEPDEPAQDDSGDEDASLDDDEAEL